jgi:hypothetical protein
MLAYERPGWQSVLAAVRIARILREDGALTGGRPMAAVEPVQEQPASSAEGASRATR